MLCIVVIIVIISIISIIIIIIIIIIIVLVVFDWNTCSIHHHLLEVIRETVTVPELSQTLVLLAWFIV